MISFKDFLLLEALSPKEHYEKYMLLKYPTLTEENYDLVAAADPTNSQSQRGKYIEWILKVLAIKAKIYNVDINKYMDIKHGNIPLDKIHKLLKRFHSHPKKIDINSFKSFLSFSEFVKELPATQNEIKQQEKDLFSNERDVQFIDNNQKWIIARPLTWKGSKMLACYKTPKGADWCTARQDSQIGFDDYDQHGILLVFINKDKPEEKYQAYYDYDSMEIGEVRDKNQVAITWDSLISYLGMYADKAVIYIKNLIRKHYNDSI